MHIISWSTAASQQQNITSIIRKIFFIYFFYFLDLYCICAAWHILCLVLVFITRYASDDAMPCNTTALLSNVIFVLQQALSPAKNVKKTTKRSPGLHFEFLNPSSFFPRKITFFFLSLSESNFLLSSPRLKNVKQVCGLPFPSWHLTALTRLFFQSCDSRSLLSKCLLNVRGGQALPQEHNPP